MHVNYLQSATSLAMQAQHAAARPLTRALSSHDVMIKESNFPLIPTQQIRMLSVCTCSTCMYIKTSMTNLQEWGITIV